MLLLGHLDVVEAKREDWTRDQFTLIEENGYFYARHVDTACTIANVVERIPIVWIFQDSNFATITR
jgi:hypothetical protein